VEGSYEIFPETDLFEIEPESGTEVKWLISAFDRVVTAKDDTISKFNPLDLTEPPTVETREYGGVGLLAVCQGPNEIFFLDKKGVISYNGSYFEDVSHIEGGSSVRNYIENIPSAYIGTSWMEYFDDTLLVGVPQGSDTYPTTILACYMPKKFWYVITGWAARCVCKYTTSAEGVVLHLGMATTGQVQRAFYGDDDDGTDITWVIRTADCDFGGSEFYKDFVKLFLNGAKLTNTDVTVTVEPYLDTVDTGLDVTEDINGGTISFDSSSNKTREIPIPQLGSLGQYLGVKITGTKRVTLRDLIQIIRVMEETYQ
jgi:hypothetical protein